MAWLVSALKLPHRVITRDDGKPYLNRWFLCGSAAEALRFFPQGDREPRWWQRLTGWLPIVYVHRFDSSDTDDELHNHPWAATSLILAGGYDEQRRAGSTQIEWDGTGGPTGTREVYKVVTNRFSPGNINRLFPDTYHKVTLLGPDCWTLIVVGEKVQSWGFWSPLTGQTVGWREHLAMRTEKKITSKGGRA